MTFQLHQTTLAGDTPGAATTLYWYTAGPEDAATRVHLQAALHADEQPGTMALHHLLPRLREADAAGQLKARFTIFPSVNPLGLGNFSLRHHIGRYDIETGVNYNRRWPDLYPRVADQIAGQLGQDPAANIALIRQAVLDWIDTQRPQTAIQQLRLLVLRSAAAADIVLDLHCWFLGTPEYLILASVSLGLVYGAFATNVIHGALRAVPRGQLEAARAYGLSASQVLWRIQIRQMWVYALPGLSNVWMLIIKATSLLSLLQIADIVLWADRLGAPNFLPAVGLVHDDWRWRYYLVLFVFYILVTWLSEKGFDFIMRRAGRGILSEAR